MQTSRLLAAKVQRRHRSQRCTTITAALGFIVSSGISQRTLFSLRLVVGSFRVALPFPATRALTHKAMTSLSPIHLS